MNRILDRYLAKKFLTIFLFSVFAFISVFIIVDLIENLDKFLNNDVPANIVIEYYIYYIPFILLLIFPVAALISSLFSVGSMARQNEVVAMKAAGISLYRILFPLFILGFFLSVVGIGIANIAVPWGSENMSIIEETYQTKKKKKSYYKLLNQIYIQDEQGNQITIRRFNLQSKTASVVSIRKFDGDDLVSRIDAKTMTWTDSLWILENGFVRVFTPEGEQAKDFQTYEFKNTSLRPAVIENIVKKPEEMSFSQLRAFINEVERNGGDVDRWLVDLYLKIAMPFATFIIVLFGAPLSSAQTRRSGATKGFGMSLAVTFIYFGILKTMQSMGHNGRVEPFLAAWSANILFAMAAFFLLFRAHK